MRDSRDNKPLEDDPEPDLKEQLAELQRAYKKRDDEAKRMADFILAIRKRPVGTHPELLLLTLAILWGARLAWFASVEAWGSHAKAEGISVTNGFLIVGGALLVIWLVHDARVNGWLALAKCAVLAVGLRIAIDQWVQGHAVNASAIAVGVLISLALPFLGRGMQIAVLFLMDPFLFTRR